MRLMFRSRLSLGRLGKLAGFTMFSRITLGIGVVFIVILSGSNVAAALSIGNRPNPGQWYKDSITVSVSNLCADGKTSYSFNYSSTDDGTHAYYFSTDDDGNPYVSIDTANSNYTPLDLGPFLNGPCGFNAKYAYGDNPVEQTSFTASIDTQPPAVSITTPTSSQTTTASSYVINGTASDPEGNLSSLQAYDNGAPGSGVSTSGNTFSTSILLSYGTNSIHLVAKDVVGHVTTSNTILITRDRPGSHESSSSSSTPSSTSGNEDSAGAASLSFGSQKVLNINDPYANQSNATPSEVQATSSLSGISGALYDWLIVLIIALFILCLYVLNRFWPIFGKRSKNRSGLRKRIIIVVALPSIIPLLGLGFLGYQQLSSIVKNSLSDQLSKASETSALKLQREFGLRNIVISKTSSDILQIISQYNGQADNLTQQKNNCQEVVSSAVPEGQYSRVTSNTDCLPFLAGFAQLLSSSGGSLSGYLDALNKGASSADQNLSAQKYQRVNELLGSLRDYFPDLLEVDIVDASKQANILAIIPRTDSSQPTTSEVHKDLLQEASTRSVIQVATSSKSQQIFITYPLVFNGKSSGGVVAAIDTQNSLFIPSILKSTPKPYSSDQVFLVTTDGDLIDSHSTDKQLLSQTKAMANTKPGSVYNLKLAKQVLAVRTTAVPNTNLVVAVGAPASSILAPLAGIQVTALLAITVFILLSILLAIWFVRGIAGEIDSLYLGAQNYAKGNLNYIIAIKSHDELQVLGDTMNQMAAEIKTAQAALLQKDKDFISVATHELRAPITAIIGFLSMVVEDGMGTVDDKASRLINQAFTSTKRLREIINDMLDIARLESGHSEFKIEPVNSNELVQSVVDMQSIVAQQAHIKLSFKASPDLPMILADKNKLQIILTNFVSNAIKYNRPNGTITVALKVEGSKLITSIKDTGLGIPENQKSHMFEKFYRVKDEDRTNVPGTGLGLHITKKFIEAMGGQVWFDSIHGEGTTFFFSLPTARPIKSDDAST